MINFPTNGADYQSHGANPLLLTVYGGSDLVLAILYFAIPVAIIVVTLRHPNSEIRTFGFPIAGLIALGGVAHVFSFIALWWAVPYGHAIAKVTMLGAALVLAVLAFWRMSRPTVSVGQSCPPTTDLASVPIELGSMTTEIEMRVAERTRELSEAVEQTNLLLRELAHRSKNMLAVVQSMARQTFRHAASR